MLDFKMYQQKETRHRRAHMNMLYNSRIFILFSALIAVTTSALCSCSSEVFQPPIPSNQNCIPLTEVTTQEIWDDYKANPEAASAKYAGKPLYFARVRVDWMSYLGYGRDPDLFVQEGVEPGVFAVKFHTWSETDIINIRDGYIVHIVAYDEGFSNGCVNLRIYWVGPIDPPGQ